MHFISLISRSKQTREIKGREYITIGMISRLVVDHISYLTAISLLGYSLKTAIDHLLQLHVT